MQMQTAQFYPTHNKIILTQINHITITTVASQSV